MRSNVTRGKGPLGRIYDRLRKRTYRNEFWSLGSAHYWYVRGVRDALKAVEAEVFSPRERPVPSGEGRIR